MPTLSVFFGIVIKMYFDDHSPPHFHAEYGEHELVVGINPIRVLAGDAPHRVRSLVFEWAAMHQQELSEDWELCKSLQTPKPIDPLD
jgi:Domain of unknown function (DUF4160)